MSQARGTTKVAFAAGDTREQREVAITEEQTDTHVRWTAREGRQLIATVDQQIVAGTCDSQDLLRAIAAHYGLDEDEVTLKRGRRSNRFVPRRVTVTLPPARPQPQVCNHLPGEPACELSTCGGIPPVTTPLDRDCAAIPPQPGGPAELGFVTVGRQLMQAVARATGLEVKWGSTANNGWADIRPGVRKVNGWLFTVGSATVRILTYEARSPLLGHPHRYAAVYVGQTLVAGAVEMERAHAWKDEVVRAITPAAEALHDAQALSAPTGEGLWRLKNPPIGFNVNTQAHGTVEVDEPSRNDGLTLHVTDAEGRGFFVDRAFNEGWLASYGGAAIDGRDNNDRFQRRLDFRTQVVSYRHHLNRHKGPPSDCVECVEDVVGASDTSTGHVWGRYVRLPWCLRCGVPATQHAVAGRRPTATGPCPGEPPGSTDLPGEDMAVTKAPGPAQVREEQPAHIRRVHVRSESPVLVDRGDGRQGLTNPTWCGRVGELPNGDKAWHVYGLEPETVTCPVCFHLFTCPWARLDDKEKHCEVCAHIYSCEDGTCNPADHPNIVPEPDPHFDRTAGADALLKRVHQAVRDGDLDLADTLCDAGEDYEPRHPIRRYGGWNGLRGHVRRLRIKAQELTQAVDHSDGELDAANVADQADPSTENEARVMIATRQHVAAFQADERAELTAKQNQPRLAATPQPDRAKTRTVHVSVTNVVGEVLHEETRRTWNAGIRASEAAVRRIARRLGITYTGQPPVRKGERDTVTDTYLRSWTTPDNIVHLVARVGRSAAPTAATPPEVPPINSGIPHRFAPKPQGEAGGSSFCVPPCHGHRSQPFHLHDGQASARPPREDRPETPDEPLLDDVWDNTLNALGV